MGRPRKKVPEFDAVIVIQSRTPERHITSRFGDFNEKWLILPGSPEDFRKAFCEFLSEYQRGPKRVRNKPDLIN